MALAIPSSDLRPWTSAPSCWEVSLSSYYSMTFEPIACVRDTPSLDRPHHSTSEPTDDWPKTTCHTADTAYPVFAFDRVMVSRRDVTAQDDSGFYERIACRLLPFSFAVTHRVWMRIRQMAVLLQAPPTSLRASASAPVFDALMHGPTANPAVSQRHTAFAFSSPWPRRATNESWLPAAD